jgi:hypothetical protein
MNDVTAYLRRLRRDGYDVGRTRGGHWRIAQDGRRVATCGSTPRRSSLTDLKSIIRRYERHRDAA